MKVIKYKQKLFRLDFDSNNVSKLVKFLQKKGYTLDENALLTVNNEVYVYSEYIDEVLKYIGYVIEITEISDTEKAVGSIAGKNWHRLHKFRWQLTVWDEFGTMTDLKYSNNNVQFDSENIAFRDAVNYILNNY